MKAVLITQYIVRLTLSFLFALVSGHQQGSRFVSDVSFLDHILHLPGGHDNAHKQQAR
jgi:hypothetical protein